MKFILVTLGSVGDVSPFIWMSKILKKNGHNVTMLTNKCFEDMVKKNNIDFVGIGRKEDYVRDKSEIKKSEKNIIQKIKFMRATIYDVFIKHTKEIYKNLSDVYTDKSIIISYFPTIGANLYSYKNNVKNINLSLSPFTISPFSFTPPYEKIRNRNVANKIKFYFDRIIYNVLFGNHMSKIAKELNIDLQKPPIYLKFDSETLCLFPEWFVDFDLGYAKNSKFTSIPVSEKVKTIPEDVKDFLEKYPEPVLFNPGTPFATDKNFFVEALKSLKIMNKPGIFVSRFSEIFPKDLPDNIYCTDFIPFEAVLKRCSLIVHHGGIGTIGHALKSGIPQIVFYFITEQQSNAKLAEKVSACRYNSYKKLSADLIVNYSKEIITDEYKDKCIKTSKKLIDESSENLFIEYIDKLK